MAAFSLAYNLDPVLPEGIEQVLQSISELTAGELPRQLLFIGHGTGAAWGTLDSVTQLAHVNLELGNRAAQRVPVHSQFARRAALVALVLLQHSQDEALLELPHRFGVKNIAFVHLQDECFQLIFHGISLSCFRCCLFL